MDRTIVNLVSLIVGGSGIFAALTDYEVPELRQSYWGDNPFRLKADAIHKLASVFFGLLAVAAILMQVVAEVVGDSLPSRIHGGCFYTLMTVATMATTFVMLVLLAKLGRKLAKRTWLPQVIESQRDLFESAQEILTNDGLRATQVGLSDTIPPVEKLRMSNLETVGETVRQIERLLEIHDTGGDLAERLNRLAPYFDK